MARKLYIPIILCVVLALCLFPGFAFSQSWHGTFLNRIVEFDAENRRGLMDSGNYVITHEHISYRIDEQGGIDITYHYRIRRLGYTGTSTFGLALRNRGQYGIGDVPVHTLRVLVDGRSVEAAYMRSPYQLFDDDGAPIIVDWDEEEGYIRNRGRVMFFGYRGWYYFCLDFPASGEADIIINWQTVFDVTPHALIIPYQSGPFWLPAVEGGTITLTIENNANGHFLSAIAGVEPTDSLVTDNWALRRPGPNIVEITAATAWIFENNGVWLQFSLLHFPSRGSPHDHFFNIWPHRWGHIWEGHGVHLGSHFRRVQRPNISHRELYPYELVFLNRWQLRIMRNAFFAAHGFRFRDEELLRVLIGAPFGRMSLDGVISIPDEFFNDNFTGETLSPIERRNVEIIQRLENLVN